MSVRDRKFYILKHNLWVENENNKGNTTHVEGEMINKFTDMSQLSEKNMRNRNGG